MQLIKLPRVHKVDGYITGDNNEYTSEYTHEDYYMATHSYPTAIQGSAEWELNEKIIQYFRDNPEIAKKNGVVLNQIV